MEDKRPGQFDWLRNYQATQNEQLRVRLNIARLETQGWALTQGYLRKQAQNEKSKTAKLEEWIKQNKEYLARLDGLLEDSKKLIDQFNDLDSKILRDKYVYGLSIKEIADKEGYAVSYIKKKSSDLNRVMLYVDKFIANEDYVQGELFFDERDANFFEPLDY